MVLGMVMVDGNWFMVYIGLYGVCLTVGMVLGHGYGWYWFGGIMQ